MNNKDIVNDHTHNILPQQGEIEKYTGTRVSQPNPQGRGEAQPVSDRETVAKCSSPDSKIKNIKKLKISGDSSQYYGYLKWEFIYLGGPPVTKCAPEMWILR